MPAQPPILAPVDAFARWLVFDLAPSADPKDALRHLSSAWQPKGMTLGIGAPFTLALGAKIDGLRSFPALTGAGMGVPSSQAALVVSLEASDPSRVHDATRALRAALEPAFVVREEVACWKYDVGRDLSGYIDGTENPKGDAAKEAALAEGGGSFVAVQRWVHDLRALEGLSEAARDAIVGRSKRTNEELGDAPSYAHVKRSAQESFDPPAFMLRRSMPWGDSTNHGLFFAAFGRSLDAYERVLERMIGAEDGVVDGLFRFSRPVSGGYYYCPPVSDDGRLDLSVVAS